MIISSRMGIFGGQDMTECEAATFVIASSQFTESIALSNKASQYPVQLNGCNEDEITHSEYSTRTFKRFT
eukprot:3637657-Ditylum_brightwellii.AAC.1